MIFNTEMTVNPDEIKALIESDKFIQFLLNNTTNFSTAAAILTFCYNGLEAAQSEAEES
jgi:hypothetical protein